MYPIPKYTRVTLSKHAVERMQLRAITEDMVNQAIRDPDRAYLEDDGDTKFIRKVNGVNLHVVCKPLPDESKWLVKSTWVRGEDDQGNRVDRYGRYQGKRRRAAAKTPRPAMAGMLLNGFLIATVMILIGVLLYFFLR